MGMSVPPVVDVTGLFRQVGTGGQVGPAHVGARVGTLALALPGTDHEVVNLDAERRFPGVWGEVVESVRLLVGHLNRDGGRGVERDDSAAALATDQPVVRHPGIVPAPT